MSFCQKWAVPEKKQAVEDIFPWNPLEFLGLFPLLLEIPDKILLQPSEILRSNQEPWKLHNFFLNMNGNSTLQSVSRRNKCMCGSSHVLCYGCLQSCANHNSFASYDGDIICACRAHKSDYKWTETLSNLITQKRHLLLIFEGEKNPLLECFCLNISVLAHFYLWCKLHLKNQTILFAFKTFFEDNKICLSDEICSLTRTLELIGFDG